MRWTQKKPTRMGRYWRRSMKAGTDTIVRVVRKNGRLEFLYEGQQFGGPVRSKGALWAGPIPAPKGGA